MSLLDSDFDLTDERTFGPHFQDINSYLSTSNAENKSLLLVESRISDYDSVIEDINKSILCLDCSLFTDASVRELEGNLIQGNLRGYYLNNIDKIPNIRKKRQAENLLNLTIGRSYAPYTPDLKPFGPIYVIARCAEIPSFIKLTPKIITKP